MSSVLALSPIEEAQRDALLNYVRRYGDFALDAEAYRTLRSELGLTKGQANRLLSLLARTGAVLVEARGALVYVRRAAPGGSRP